MKSKLLIYILALVFTNCFISNTDLLGDISLLKLKQASAQGSMESLLKLAFNDPKKLSELGYISIIDTKTGKVTLISGSFHSDSDYTPGGPSDVGGWSDGWEDAWNMDYTQKWAQCKKSESYTGEGTLKVSKDAIEAGGKGSVDNDFNDGVKGECPGGNEEYCRSSICF